MLAGILGLPLGREFGLDRIIGKLVMGDFQCRMSDICNWEELVNLK